MFVYQGTLASGMDILVVMLCGIFLPAISLMSVLLFASENDQLESSNGLLNPTRLVGPIGRAVLTDIISVHGSRLN